MSLGVEMKAAPVWKRVIACFAAGLSLAMPATSVQAEQLTAGELYSFCTATDDVSQAACRFFVLGVVEGIELADGSTMGKDRRVVAGKKTIFCAPDDVSVYKLTDVFKSRVATLRQAYPDDMKLPAVGVVGAAMVSAYP